MNIPDLPWSAPLHVRLQCGVERTFSSVYGALDFLENEWPLRKGERYERALRLCHGALNKFAPASVAREAFVAACIEANMPIVTRQPTRLRSSYRPSAHRPAA